ncbi:MAG: ribonuclease HI family protein [Phycisphaerae bacterium]|nr:ribonuclease HI family protein [Phycisphaerae bacterium]
MYLRINADGGSRGNPGPAGAGVAICDRNGNVVFEGGFYLGTQTNNVAEYTGLLKGLETAKELGGTELDVKLDSELIVKQINGIYKVKNPTLKTFYQQICQLIGEFDKVKVSHVYREDNAHADAMANQAMDARSDTGGFKDPVVLTEVVSPGNYAGELIAFADLREAISSSPDGICHKVLSDAENAVTELICLEPGKTYQMNKAAGKAFVTVMRGAGEIVIGSTVKPVKVGCWLQLAGVEGLVLNANADQQLIAIVTICV